MKNLLEVIDDGREDFVKKYQTITKPLPNPITLNSMKLKWKQERILETDLTKAVAGTGLSLRKIAKGCGVHYTHLSRALNGKVVLGEQSFAKLTNFLEDNQL